MVPLYYTLKLCVWVPKISLPMMLGIYDSQGKGKYEAKLEIPRGGGLQTKQPSMVKVWLFSEITGACFDMLQFTFQFLVSHFSLGLVCQA